MGLSRGVLRCPSSPVASASLFDTPECRPVIVPFASWGPEPVASSCVPVSTLIGAHLAGQVPPGRHK